MSPEEMDARIKAAKQAIYEAAVRSDMEDVPPGTRMAGLDALLTEDAPCMKATANTGSNASCPERPVRYADSVGLRTHCACWWAAGLATKCCACGHVCGGGQ